MSETDLRKIIHCDCDCFFAAIEMRDDSSLRGLPVAVGGHSDRRGVISTCNYEARKYGVRSAMSSAAAMRACPGLIIVPTHMDKYREASQQVRGIFFQYTDLVEPLSIDEAFLDVSASQLCRGSATLMAQDMRAKIHKEVGITVSAGIAPNKFLAKIGSDMNKPDGQFVLRPEDVAGFLQTLEVKKLFGVGQVTAKKLHQRGIETCGDLLRFNVFELTELFGRFGKRLFELSRGIDNRPVKTTHRRKSLSVEHTYDSDIADLSGCLAKLPDLHRELRSRLRRVDDDFLITKQFIKVKFNDFSTTTVECLSPDSRLAVFEALCEEALGRRDLPVRLLGMGVRFVDLQDQRNPLQLELFDAEEAPPGTLIMLP